MPIDNRLYLISITIVIFSCIVAIVVPEAFDVPYAFYNIIRLSVFVPLSYITYYLYKSGFFKIAFFTVAFTILYNPVMPIFLKRDIWIVVDILILILLFVAIYFTKNKAYTHRNNTTNDANCKIRKEIAKLNNYVSNIENKCDDIESIQDQVNLIGISLGQFQENLLKFLFKQHGLAYNNLRIVEAIKILTEFYDKNIINDFFHINQVRNKIIHSSDRDGDIDKSNKDYLIADIKAAIAKAQYLNTNLNI